MTKQKLKLPKKWEYTLTTIIFIGLLILFIYGRNKNISINKHGKVVQAYVYKIERSGKSGVQMYYKYIVDGIEYHDNSAYYGMPYIVHAGDSIEILYDSTSVNHSNPLGWSPW